MNIKKNILVTLGLSLGLLTASAQQDAHYTMYTLNPMSVNSAYAGTRGHASVIGMHRSQWVGLDGAPRTQHVSFDTPLSDRVGLGVSVINDELGPSDEFFSDLNFSYRIPISETHTLSFGLKAGARVLNIDLSKADSQEQADPALQDINNQWLATIGAGIYAYGERSYIGLSIPNFVRSEHRSYDGTSFSASAEEAIHWNLIGGLVTNVSEKVKLKPSFLLKHVSGAPLSLDLSATFLIGDVFMIGSSYRWDDSISGLIGFYVNPRLFLGYAYDYTTTPYRDFNNGSHEIALRLDIFRDEVLKSPRFF